MDCRIDWDCPRATWDGMFAGLRRSTLLQARGYADALCPTLGQRPRRGLIRIDGAPAGLVQIQEAAALRRALHAVILDRGPLWAEGFGGRAHVAAFFETFCRAFPARPGRRRRILPEADQAQAAGLARTGDLRPRPGVTPYQTIWLDLTADAAARRARLRPKWRAGLDKAEAAGLTACWDWQGADLPAFLAAYRLDKAQKGYPGPAPDTLARLCLRLAAEDAVAVGLARGGDGTPVAGALFLRHGRAATFQAGWVAEAGRRAAANHLLLWDAQRALRAQGVDDLDMGGVNDADAAGVKRFKAGLGGGAVTLAGQFR